jgi:glycosyltransferase involved in cell wall biosynthesis
LEIPVTDSLPEVLPEIPFVRPLAKDAYFAPESIASAPRPVAVMYQGEYETLWDGTAVAVRAHARALHQAGIPVSLKSFTGMVTDEHGRIQPRHGIELDPEVDRQVGALELVRAHTYFPRILHLVVRDAEHLKRAVMPQGIVSDDIEEAQKLRKAIYDSTIIYSVWERDRVDPGIVKTLSRVAECWVPSTANRNMLISSGVPPEKLFVIPHPYDPAGDILKLRRRKADGAWKKFYSIGRWEPRKGYNELVNAFLMTFTPADKAILTIKYTGGKWPDYPTPEEVMESVSASKGFAERGWTREKIKERVKLIEGRFPRAAILELHYRNNIYVSSSHGEAWNLPAFEAALAGNNVCYVPSGGVEDFLGNGHACVAPLGLEPVPASYGWEAGAQWTSYSVRSLGKAMELSFAPATTHNRPDAIALERFTLEAVGKLMRERVLVVAGRQRIEGAVYQ